MSLYADALKECRVELGAEFESLKKDLEVKIAVDGALLDEFVAGFEADFKEALTEKDGTDSPAAWQMTRAQLMLKVRAIASLALSYAAIAQRTALEQGDLLRALQRVKPDCEVTTDPAKRKRLNYCAGAWGLQGLR